MNEKTERYRSLLLEIKNMAEEYGEEKRLAEITDIDAEITVTMRELRQFIERLRRAKEGE